MPEIVGKVLVKDNVLYLFDGNHSIPLFVWMVSHNIKVGDFVKVKVEKKENIENGM